MLLSLTSGLPQTVDNAAIWRSSPSKGLIVSGTSAGGNFAAVLAHRSIGDPFFTEKGVSITGQALFMPTLLHPDVRPNE